MEQLTQLIDPVLSGIIIICGGRLAPVRVRQAIVDSETTSHTATVVWLWQIFRPQGLAFSVVEALA